MRTSTKVSIGSAAGWLLLTVISNVAAPSGLDDPNFAQEVNTASGFQTFGNLLLIAAIIAILIRASKFTTFQCV